MRPFSICFLGIATITLSGSSLLTLPAFTLDKGRKASSLSLEVLLLDLLDLLFLEDPFHVEKEVLVFRSSLITLFQLDQFDGGFLGVTVDLAALGVLNALEK